VLGNVLGVGVLALPVKTGLSGYVPALIGILFIWLVMLITAWVIAYRLGDKENFDIPSFYHQEVGSIGKWLAIACNLLLLYGVLVAYLSGISAMITNLFHVQVPQWVVIVIYFMILSGLIMFGTEVLHKGNALIIAGIWICFGILIYSGISHFDEHTLFGTYEWKYMPVGFPIVVSAFHFHNIIPTVRRTMRHDFRGTCKAIFLGVFLGLVINVVWVTVVLASLPEISTGADSIVNANVHNWPANIPMSDLLKSQTFKIASLVFALLAVSASYVANGTGLFGFVRDLTSTYFKTNNRLLVGALSFLPPLLVTLIYPNIFLNALEIVGGIGETILFVVLPGFILWRITRKVKGMKWLSIVGIIIFLLGMFITLYVFGMETGIIKKHYPGQPAKVEQKQAKP
jgi:tyrosine-specific transport protein